MVLDKVPAILFYRPTKTHCIFIHPLSLFIRPAADVSQLTPQITNLPLLVLFGKICHKVRNATALRGDYKML